MAMKSLCSIPDCGKAARSKGYCQNHYYRYRVHGDPLAGRTAPGEPMAWLERHVTHQGDECLIWPFARFPHGYAAVVVNGKTTHASNVMCRLAHGEPADGVDFSLHSCTGASDGCIHPGHLRWGTQGENMQDSVRIGTRCRGEDQHAHKLTEADVRDIRRLRGTMMQKEIAAQFGVDPETVRRIQNRQAWAWLE